MISDVSSALTKIKDYLSGFPNLLIQDTGTESFQLLELLLTSWGIKFEVHQGDFCSLWEALPGKTWVSTLTKERLYLHLYEPLSVDYGQIHPFGSLFFSELSQLKDEKSLFAGSCPPVSLEWLIRLDLQTGLLAAIVPSQHPTWGGMSGEQRALYARYHQIYHDNLRRLHPPPLNLRTQHWIR